MRRDGLFKGGWLYSDGGTFFGSGRGLPGDLLKGMRFAVFGLGDSGYTKYNATARKLHARLLQLGASELVSSVSESPNLKISTKWSVSRS